MTSDYDFDVAEVGDRVQYDIPHLFHCVKARITDVEEKKDGEITRLVTMRPEDERYKTVIMRISEEALADDSYELTLISWDND